MSDPSVLHEMPQANYLIGHADGPQYRLIMRHFYEQHRAHHHYVRSDEVLAYVQRVFPQYDDPACRRQLDQLEKWQLIRALPEQSKPANLMELRQRPRTYQAERIALRLEDLRVRLEEEHAAASTMNPAALEQLAQRLVELVQWVRQGLGQTAPQSRQRTHSLWHAVLRAFDEFARGAEDYLSDLPRHRPRESMDYLRFREYRDLITRYLSEYVRRLFDRREYIRHLLEQLGLQAEQLLAEVADVAAQQVRADGSLPLLAAELDRSRADLTGLVAYFAEGGDVDVMLEQAQGWVADITRHARRLSEQHLGGTVREQTLLDLAERFAGQTSREEAERLAQVAFGATLPLHWKGQAPEAAEGSAWQQPPMAVALQVIRRGSRQRLHPDSTPDRTAEQMQRMLAESGTREQAALALAALFPPDDVLDLARLQVPSPVQRQQLLRLIYRALSHNGQASVGFRDWQVTVELPAEHELGQVLAPDGQLLLPRYRLRLHRGRRVHG